MSQRLEREGYAARLLGTVGFSFLFLTVVAHCAGASATKNEDSAGAGLAAASTTAPGAISGASAALPENGDETLLLDVRVNGHSIGKIGEFVLRRGLLLARPDELRDLGFRVPASPFPGSETLIALSDLHGLAWKLDEKNLLLFVTVGDAGLLPTLLRFTGLRSSEEQRTIESGAGATMNYDVVSTLASGKNGATGSFDLRAFSPWGVVSSEWLAYTGASAPGASANRAIRLDSAYSFADVNTLRRYILGDFITGGLSWTRPVHLEGVQIRSDFSMRPDLVTFPLPTFTGSAAVPSTVTVLADGNQMVSSQVGAGPFEIPSLPVISGAGTVSMTVTNSLGQQVTLSQPFYASSALLAPRLQTFAAQAGLVRRNWGVAGSDYGKLACAAIYRRGLTRMFTIEGSAEATSGAFTAGGGGVAQIGALGDINFAAAGSAGSGYAGAQFSLGAQRIGRKFSLGGSAIIATRNYRDVAAMNGDGVLRKQLSAFTSLSLRRLGSAGAAYGGVDQDVAPVLLGASGAEHSHVVSANYTLQLHRASIYATEFKDLAGAGGSSGFQLGLTVPFGRRSSLSVNAMSGGNAQLQAQQAAPRIGDWGYQAYASVGDSRHAFVEEQYKSPVGLFMAGVDNTAGQTTFRIESQGAFSLAGGGLFPSNEIYDSFAIVDTSPMTHVEVLQENRHVGRTDSAGRLLVPDMRSFDLNHITIEPNDIPPDVTVNNASRELRPQDRSGVVVKFSIKLSHGALLKLVDESGAPLPLGSAATLKATGATVPVGYDGDAYVEDLEPHNELSIELTDGHRCRVTFDYRPDPGNIPSIGPLRCVEKQP